MRVAIWCELGHALGRVHRDLTTRLRADGHEVVLFDWHSYEEGTLPMQRAFLTFDRVISTSFMTSCKGFDMTSPHVRARMIAVAHSGLPGNAWFHEKFEHVSWATPIFCAGAVSLDALDVFSATVSQPMKYLPCGVDLDVFPLLPQPLTGVAVIGFVGNLNHDSAGYNDVKRPAWARELAHLTGCTLVEIMGRGTGSSPLSHELYSGIDLLVCTSTSEGGPLGILEAAAVGVPVLSTRVGNVARLRTVSFFSTVAEAVAIVRDWQQDADKLRTYAKAVTSEVRERFNWDVLYEQHWKPLFQGPSGLHLNFLEIGTSDFDTCCQTCAPDALGVCVEPVLRYLEALPVKPGVIKVHGAVSDHAGSIDVYYVKPELIEQLGLPAWCRGCNQVNQMHPLVVAELEKKGVDPVTAFTVERAPVFTFGGLVREYNIRAMEVLKIDTEGHDCTIMRGVLEACVASPTLFPRKIVFETNEHSKPEDVDAIVAGFAAHGYMAERGYDTILRRQW